MARTVRDPVRCTVYDGDKDELHPRWWGLVPLQLALVPPFQTGISGESSQGTVVCLGGPGQVDRVPPVRRAARFTHESTGRGTSAPSLGDIVQVRDFI